MTEFVEVMTGECFIIQLHMPASVRRLRVDRHHHVDPQEEPPTAPLSLTRTPRIDTCILMCATHSSVFIACSYTVRLRIETAQCRPWLGADYGDSKVF